MNIETAKLRIDITNQVVYRYLKKLGLVNKTYARKVLSVSEKKFEELVLEYNLEVTEMPSPNLSFKTRLYHLKKIYEIKEKLINA